MGTHFKVRFCLTVLTGSLAEDLKGALRGGPSTAAASSGWILPAAFSWVSLMPGADCLPNQNQNASGALGLGEGNRWKDLTVDSAHCNPPLQVRSPTSAPMRAATSVTPTRVTASSTPVPTT